VSWSILYEVLSEKEALEFKNIALANEKSDLKAKLKHQ
jgi:hypothetical protein